MHCHKLCLMLMSLLPLLLFILLLHSFCTRRCTALLAGSYCKKTRHLLLLLLRLQLFLLLIVLLLLLLRRSCSMQGTELLTSLQSPVRSMQLFLFCSWSRLR